MTLVKRSQTDEETNSAYRFGEAGDTRILSVATDKAGKLLSLRVRADPAVR